MRHRRIAGGSSRARRSRRRLFERRASTAPARRRRPQPAGGAAAERGGARARRRRRPERRRPSSAARRARRSTSWPGRATSRTASTDPDYDWVTDVRDSRPAARSTPQIVRDRPTRRTPCSSTNPEQYDGVSASGDASLRLFAAASSQPVNLDLFTNYAGHLRGPQEQAVQHGRRRPLRRPARPRLEPAHVADRPGHAGPDDAGRSVRSRRSTATRSASTTRRSTSPTRPSYLMTTKPDARDHEPVRPRRRAVRGRGRPAQGSRSRPSRQYWGDYLKQMDDFRAGDIDVGTTWQSSANLLQAEEPAGPGRRHQADRRGDRLVRHLDDQLEDQEPRTARTRSSTTSSRPRPTPTIAEYFGEAPGNSQVAAPAEHAEPGATATTSSTPTDDAFWKDVWYWQTPTDDCVDGRTDVKCKDFNDWIKAWTEIKG